MENEQKIGCNNSEWILSWHMIWRILFSCFSSDVFFFSTFLQYVNLTWISSIEIEKIGYFSQTLTTFWLLRSFFLLFDFRFLLFVSCFCSLNSSFIFSCKDAKVGSTARVFSTWVDKNMSNSDVETVLVTLVWNASVSEESVVL